MNRRHQKTHDAIFSDPVRASVVWAEVESMLKHMGATITEGAGSRVRIELAGVDAVFHRPHPGKEADKGAVKSMRRFLETAASAAADREDQEPGKPPEEEQP